MAFDTAISGMRAATTDLNAIGNNVANSSTTGFKTSRAEFADVYASSLLGAGSSVTGKGVTLSAVTQEFSQGNISFTNNALDLAISGSGFFTLSDDGARVYSRAGNFSIDREGYLVNNDGLNLQGYQATDLGDIVNTVDDLRVLTNLIDPQQTAEVEVIGNLDSREVPPAVSFAAAYDAFGSPATSPDTTEFNSSTSATIYDSLGNSHLLNMYFVKSAASNAWDVHTLVDGVTVGTPQTLNFQSDGQLDPATLPVEVNVAGWTPLDDTGAANGASTQSFSVDLSDFSQFGTDFSVSSVIQDGYSTGQLSGLDIEETGIIYARYTNGQSRGLGQVVVTGFNNEAGLQAVGNTNWVETFSSGEATTGEPGSGGLGVLQSGALEDSNVEITEQLVNMIVAQRNFQANAQVIQAEDAVTQTIINLR